MERIQGLLWPALILALSAGLSKVYMRVVVNRWKKAWGGGDAPSVEFVKKNSLKITLTLGFPGILVDPSLSEELVFRLPLLLLFSEVSPLSFCAIVLSAFLFARIHGNRKMMAAGLLTEKSRTESGATSLDEMIREAEREKPD